MNMAKILRKKGFRYNKLSLLEDNYWAIGHGKDGFHLISYETWNNKYGHNPDNTTYYKHLEALKQYKDIL